VSETIASTRAPDRAARLWLVERAFDVLYAEAAVSTSRATGWPPTRTARA